MAAREFAPGSPAASAARAALATPAGSPRPPQHLQQHGATVLSCRRSSPGPPWPAASEAAAQPAMVTCSSSPASPTAPPTKPPAMDVEAGRAREPESGHVRLRVSWKGRFVQVRGLQRRRAGGALMAAALPTAAPPHVHPTRQPRPYFAPPAAGRRRRLALPGRRPLPGEPARVDQVRAADAAALQSRPLSRRRPTRHTTHPAAIRPALLHALSARRYADLMFSLSEKVDGAVSVKYQMPGEELDPEALISVNDDGDIKVGAGRGCCWVLAAGRCCLRGVLWLQQVLLPQCADAAAVGC